MSKKKVKKVKNEVESNTASFSRDRYEFNHTTRFRFWAFTFNNYEEDEHEYRKRLKSRCSMFHFGHEICPTTGTPHLQGFLHVRKGLGTKGQGFKLSEMKSFFGDKVSFRPCWASEKHNMKYTGKGTDIIYYGPTRLTVISALEPWQTQLCEILDEEPDDRTIHWIYNTNGLAGKTVFCKWIYEKYDAIIIAKGEYNDIAQILAGAIKYGRNLNDKTIIAFNYGKAASGISYLGLESLKDGLMTSPKYESQTIVFNCPHVVVFSNKLPRITKLSFDRWRIWQLDSRDSDLIDITASILYG